YRGLVAVRDCPNDVLRAERRVAAEEHARQRASHSGLIDLRHAPLVELDADVALDPRKGVLLADRDKDVVARNGLVRLAGRHQLAPALRVALGLDLFEGDARESAVLVLERLGHHVIEDWDALVHSVLFFPGGRFHFLEARSHDHLYVVAAESARRAA